MRGVEKILKTNPEIKVISEFWPAGIRRSGSSPEEYLDYMLSLGFEMELVDNWKYSRRKFVKSDISTIKGEEYVDLLFSRPPS